MRTFIFKLLKDAPTTQPFITDCIKVAADTKEGRIAFNYENVLMNWIYLENVLEENHFATLIHNLILETNFLEEVCKGEYSSDKAGLYIYIARAGDIEPDNVFAKWCIDGLNMISSKQWEFDFNHSNRNSDLVIDLLENNVELDLGEGLTTAILNHANYVLESGYESDTIEKILPLLPRALNSSQREYLSSQLLNIAVDLHGNKLPARFFHIFGDAMIIEKALMRTTNIFTNLFIPIVSRKGSKSESKKWLLDVLRSSNNLLLKFKPRDEVKSFRKEVRNAIQKSGTTNKYVVAINDLLNNIFSNS